MNDDTRFDGSDYQPPRDNPRLSRQYIRVFELMKDARWRRLKVIADTTGDPEASVSAQLRHMRKPRFGSHTIEKRHKGEGLYEYRLIVRPAWQAIEPTEKKAHCITCSCSKLQPDEVPPNQARMNV